jgi:hypothetical protein
MTQVLRKQCADCGTPSLQSDPSCWACGARDFVPVGTKPAGERTMAMGSSMDRTIAARMQRSLPPQLPLIAAGLSAALLIALAGYWVGRVSSPAHDLDTVAVSPVRQPIALPPPPVAQSAFAQFPPAVYPSAPTQPFEPVQVTIRSAPNQPKPAPKQPVAGPTPPPGPVLPVSLAATAALAAPPPA